MMAGRVSKPFGQRGLGARGCGSLRRRSRKVLHKKMVDRNDAGWFHMAIDAHRDVETDDIVHVGVVRDELERLWEGWSWPRRC